MKKIRNKLMLTMMVFTLLPTILIGAYSLYTTSEALRHTALSEQRHQLTQIQHNIESHVAGVERDLLFLRDSSAMQLYLAAKKSPAKRGRLLLQNLRNSALQFTQRQQIYSAVRLLDPQGTEVVRVERTDGLAKSLVEKKALRKQSEQDYFKQTLSLQRDQVYISPLELRRDNKVVATPHQATIRYATVVTDIDGNTQGVLVLNLDANHLIEQAIRPSDPAWMLLFTNPKGYFYYHPNQEKRWGSSKDLNTKYNAFTDDALSLLTFKGTDKAQSLEGEKNLTLSRPVSLGEGRPSLGYLFSITPKQLLLKPVQDYFNVSLIIAGISLLLSLVFAMILANSLSEPLVSLKEQVESLSQGDLEKPINTKAKNEIDDLARAIELLRKSMNILMKRSRKA